MGESTCSALHAVVNGLTRFEFPPPERQVASNGLYFIFERGECAHGADRIVRVGSHTGHGNLLARLREHVTHNKDRSIFRKNVGRALLAKVHDPFLDDWNRDLTSHAARERFSARIDMTKQTQVEDDVTRYIRANMTLCTISTPGQDIALELEKRCIGTVAMCGGCHPSPGWLGSFSPLAAVRESGLWQVQHLRGSALDTEAMMELERFAARGA